LYLRGIPLLANDNLIILHFISAPNPGGKDYFVRFLANFLTAFPS
jgi:hypothetical protein